MTIFQTRWLNLSRHKIEGHFHTNEQDCLPMPPWRCSWTSWKSQRKTPLHLLPSFSTPSILLCNFHKILSCPLICLSSLKIYWIFTETNVSYTWPLQSQVPSVLCEWLHSLPNESTLLLDQIHIQAFCFLAQPLLHEANGHSEIQQGPRARFKFKQIDKLTQPHEWSCRNWSFDREWCF